MTVSHKLRAAVAAAFLIVLSHQAPSDCVAGEIEVGLGVGVSRSFSATKGSSTEVTVPLSVKAIVNEQVDLGLVLPLYVHQNIGQGSGNRTITVGGRRINNLTAAVKTSNDGIGDLDLMYGYTLMKDAGVLPKARTFIDIKLPTARQPIGTGKTDGTLGLELSKWLGDWYLFADGGYTLQGRTTLYRAVNFFDYDAGIGVELMRSILPSIGYKGASPVEIKGGYDSRIEGRITYSAVRAIDFILYADRGLTKASPDWEFGTALRYSLGYSCDWF